MLSLKYKRVLLKLSDEALSGGQGHGLDDDITESICDAIKVVHDEGLGIAMVVDGGNFWRGRSPKIDRATSDSMGMLGTTINALRLQASLKAKGIQTRVQAAVDMKQVAEPYTRGRAIGHIGKGKIIIFTAGTGLPYFSADTTAALRAVKADADIILANKRGTDGIYDSDPNKNKNATKCDKLTYIDILNKGLGTVDTTTASPCMENNINSVVFGIDDPKNIIRISHGEDIGTIIEGDENG